MGLSPNPFHIFLSGGAGTGKSRLIKAIYHQVSRTLQTSGQDPDHPCIKLTAPTGCAAFNIGGSTIHSALKLPVKGGYYSLRGNPSMLATFQSKYENLLILVIDEVSMLGRKAFAHVHKRLQEIKNVEGTDKIFGGVCVLAVGDMFQIPPVRECRIYDTSPSHNLDEMGVLLSNLWTNNFQFHELKIIMRQKDDLPFAATLNRLRLAEHTAEDIETLKARVIKGSDYPSEALHIFSIRRNVNDHNEQMLHNLDHQTHRTVKSFTHIPPSVTSFDVNSKVADLPHTLELAPHARVMLIKNLDVNDGLVNGATGLLLDLIYNQNAKPPSLPKCVIVRFDDPSSGLLTQQASTISLNNYPQGTPIYPIEVQEHVGRSETSPQITRIQLPLVLCFACTIHKIQGATLKNVVMSCSNIRQPGMMYVACSRVTTLSGLHLLDFKPESIKASASTKEEMTRLRTEMKLQTFYDQLEKDPTCLRVLLFNIRSVQNKENHINSDPYLGSVDIMILTETWKKNKTDINVPQFHYQYHSVRTENRGGGVSVLSQTPMIPIQMQVSSDVCDAIVLQYKRDSAKINIIAVYRPPSCTFEKFMRWLTKILTSINRDIPTLIAGDFNINLLETSAAYRGLHVFMNHIHFKQVINTATHQLGGLLDHLWINSGVTVSQQMLARSPYSDHFQIFADLQL
ncbi:ATP-dependent DNA helicase PIF1 [Mytilus galloprovincialis]|uniref:ATP-dependent DNA helicase n=1 Tax=Mytilus galloprovincialis TaxID=29158 RepID=A0A8B6CRY1_MYTGA|nr:ATP-dependent DNA helicase PIF1 [Mytilus galloprovincialis]